MMSAKFCAVRLFSNPSGMSDNPELLRDSRSARRIVSSVFCERNVMLFAVSATMIPLSSRPS